MDEAVAKCTPYFELYLSFKQWGVGVAWKPRYEYAIEFQLLCFVITMRWRHGWWGDGTVPE